MGLRPGFELRMPPWIAKKRINLRNALPIYLVLSKICQKQARTYPTLLLIVVEQVLLALLISQVSLLIWLVHQKRSAQRWTIVPTQTKENVPWILHWQLITLPKLQGIAK